MSTLPLREDMTQHLFKMIAETLVSLDERVTALETKSPKAKKKAVKKASLVRKGSQKKASLKKKKRK